MYIVINDKTDPYEIVNGIHADFEKWRFKIGKIEVKSGRKSKITIAQVRLKTSKEYCGSHPNACDIGGPECKGAFLEGADWVEFNDRLNDVLDALSVDARVYATYVPVEIRRGKMRRINYSSHYLPDRFGEQYQWDKDGDDEDYEDWCGKVAPNSEWPEGTPGLYERKSA